MNMTYLYLPMKKQVLLLSSRNVENIENKVVLQAGPELPNESLMKRKRDINNLHPPEKDLTKPNDLQAPH